MVGDVFTETIQVGHLRVLSGGISPLGRIFITNVRATKHDGIIDHHIKI